MRALVLAVTLFGCTQTQVRKAHRVGEIATAGGLIGVLVSVTAASVTPYEDTLMGVGLVFVPVSLIGALLYIATDEGSRAPEQHAPLVTRREQRRETAWELTRKAADAARAEDCTQVQAIDPRVRDLDLDFHNVVFMRDVGIQHCLRGR